MCICIYNVHVHTYTYVHICMYIHIHIYVFLYICIYIHAYIYICTYICYSSTFSNRKYTYIGVLNLLARSWWKSSSNESRRLRVWAKTHLKLPCAVYLKGRVRVWEWVHQGCLYELSISNALYNCVLVCGVYVCVPPLLLASGVLRVEGLTVCSELRGSLQHIATHCNTQQHHCITLQHYCIHTYIRAHTLVMHKGALHVVHLDVL